MRRPTATSTSPCQTDGASQKRSAFSITRATLPLAHRIVEDHRLEPSEDGRSRFVWTVGYDLRWFMKPVSFVITKQFGGIFEKAIQSRVEYIEKRSQS